MIPLHQSTWKKAGIFDAILSSTFKICKNDDLVFGFAERWCPETRSFIFPWGETTITLEDMMVISGYSVLGSSVAASRLETEELKEIEARAEIIRTPSQKAYHSLWMKNWKDSGNEIEHEAFLSLWLSSEEVLLFAQCLRASSLVGLGCIESYFPHRVARQFGFDQVYAR